MLQFSSYTHFKRRHSPNLHFALVFFSSDKRFFLGSNEKKKKSLVTASLSTTASQGGVTYHIRDIDGNEYRALIDAAVVGKNVSGNKARACV